MKNKYGYTLIEILVVVAIAFILIAVIIPAVNSVQKRGLQAACMSNMKQIGFALDLYVMDYDYYYPKIFANTEGGSSYKWDVFLARNGYVTGVNKNITAGNAPGNLFICPLHLKMAKREGKSIIRSYGMNAHIRKLGGTGSESVANDINVKKNWCQFPYSEALLVAESQGATIDSNEETVYFAAFVAWTRHGERANYLFADSHVEYLTESEIKAESNNFEWK
ncbi:MAG: prepilin-type N-terminal cleavage/methylation domain-containing protein [Candidatus Aureabacteria bacterium]|nr:prepilin-type N-terminal cleavage/methylation domain-containing protein [Candidatus Auribacterota bacterium]